MGKEIEFMDLNSTIKAYNELCDKIKELEKKKDKFLCTNQTLKLQMASLIEYDINHAVDCLYYRRLGDCDCGLDDLLKEIKEGI